MIKAPTPKARELFFLRVLILGAVAYSCYFLDWFFDVNFIGNTFLFSLISIMIVYRFLRLLHQWVHLFFLPRKRIQSISTKQLTVDVFTTFVPGEPYEMIENTLLAIKKIKYPHQSFLCSEGDDERLENFCIRHDIKFVPRYEKVDAKAGNVNNALIKQSKADICVILDPDHVPTEDFIDVVLPYFEDENVGFVQVPQVYDNQKYSWVAKGAAQQTYEFYGPLMQASNRFGTTPVIGANCTFRRAALDSIGGHAPGLTEDMHTSILLHSKGWKSVFVPEVVSKGQVPVNLSSYVKQQLKWSRGSFDLFIKVLPTIFKNLSWQQRFHYLSIPLYFLFGFLMLIDFLVPTYSLFTGDYPLRCRMDDLVIMIAPLIALSFYIKLYAQKWYYENHERGIHIFGEILRISAWWYNFLGFIYTLIGKKVPYIPTSKDNKVHNELRISLPNIIAISVMIIAIFFGLSRDWSTSSILMASYLGVLTSVLSLGVIFGLGQFLNKIKNFTNAVSVFGFIFVRKTAFIFIFISLVMNLLYFKLVRDKVYSLSPIKPPRIGNTGGFYVTHSNFEKGNVSLYNRVNIDEINKRSENGKFPFISLNLMPKDSSELINALDSLRLHELKSDCFLEIFQKHDTITANRYNDLWKIADEYFKKNGVIPTLVFLCKNAEEIRKNMPDRRYVDWILYQPLAENLDDLYQSLDDISHEFYLNQTPIILKTNLSLNQSNLDSILFDFKEIKGVFSSGEISVPNDINLASNKKMLTENQKKSNKEIQPFKGIYYNVSQDWKDEFQTLTRKSLKYDFKRIKESGANTILRYGPTIGDQNIIEIANDENLNLVYGFKIDADLDFTDNNVCKLEKERILHLFNELKSKKNIVMWQMGQNTLEKIEEYNVMPFTNIQKYAFLNLIAEITDYIHQHDERPVSINTILDERIYFSSQLIDNYANNLDVIGLEVYDLEDFKHVSKADLDKSSIYFSSVGTEGYSDFLRNNVMQIVDVDSTLVKNIPIEKNIHSKGEYLAQSLDSLQKYSAIGGFINCWSDKMQGTFTWSGLTDYKGRLKPRYYTLKSVWDTNYAEIKFPQIEIILKDEYVLEKDNYQFKIKISDREKYKNVSWVLTKNGTIPLSNNYLKIINEDKVEINIPEDENDLDVYVLYGFVADKNNENVITESYLLPLRWYYK